MLEVKKCYRKIIAQNKRNKEFGMGVLERLDHVKKQGSEHCRVDGSVFK